MTGFGNLLVGTKGWRHSSWYNSFYPEDLPEEWELDFYGQYFKCVLIAQDDWLNWSDGFVLEVFETTGTSGTDFSMVFELKDYADSSVLLKLSKIKKNLQDSAAKVLCFGLNEQSFTTLQDALPGFKITACAEQSVMSGWFCSSEYGVLSGEPLFLVKLEGRKTAEYPSLLKPFLDSLPAEMSGGEIFVLDEDIQIKALSDLRILVEFLGY